MGCHDDLDGKGWAQFCTPAWEIWREEKTSSNSTWVNVLSPSSWQVGISVLKSWRGGQAMLGEGGVHLGPWLDEVIWSPVTPSWRRRAWEVSRPGPVGRLSRERKSFKERGSPALRSPTGVGCPRSRFPPGYPRARGEDQNDNFQTADKAPGS
jgi:hypothetical protein